MTIKTIENITKDELLDKIGSFTYMFGMEFFIETDIGNFVWKDPDYSGDNTLTYVPMSYAEWTKLDNHPSYGRCKGTHMLKDYIGACVPTLRVFINDVKRS